MDSEIEYLNDVIFSVLVFEVMIPQVNYMKKRIPAIAASKYARKKLYIWNDHFTCYVGFIIHFDTFGKII